MGCQHTDHSTVEIIKMYIKPSWKLNGHRKQKQMNPSQPRVPEVQGIDGDPLHVIFLLDLGGLIT